MLTKIELAKQYKVSVRTVSYWMKRKTIPYVRIGNVVRFDLEKIEKVFAAYTVKTVGQERVESKDLERASGFLEMQRAVLKPLWICQSFTSYSIFLILGSSIYMLVHVIKSPKNE